MKYNLATVAVQLLLLMAIVEVTFVKGCQYAAAAKDKPFRRTSARYNNKSIAIGDDSNAKIIAVEKMMAEGRTFEESIATLSESSFPSRFCRNSNVRCVSSQRYRNIDGTCNNLQYPLAGAGLTPLNRLLAPRYPDGYNEPVGGKRDSTLPNPRLISTTMHPDLIDPDETLTNFIPIVGVFLDHDMTFSPETDRDCCGRERNSNVDCFPIDIPRNDSFYSSKGQTCLAFTRSVPFCFPGQSGIREQGNQLTAFIDNSNVFGSDSERSDSLREHEGGRLRVNNKDPKFLPTNDQIQQVTGHRPEIMGEFAAGDDRVNEMPALTVMHTLMLREHNRLARQIQRYRPAWSDEEIFQNARRILIAQWQKVIFGEYLPIILGRNVMAQYGLNVFPTRHSAYDRRVNPSIFQAFSTSAYRFGHTLINGLVRLFRDTTEVGQYKVRDGFFTSKQVRSFNGQGYDYILGGLMQQNAQTYDRFVTEDLSNFVLRLPENNFGSDLIARNIQRGRDHGIPAYTDYREFCRLGSLSNSWLHRPREIPEESWRILRSLYRTPRDIELFPAGLAETPLSGAVSGPTFNCLKAHQFYRVKYGDRFFYTHGGQVGSFTASQIAAINDITLGDIVCQNSNNKRTTANVFRPVSPSNPWIQCDDTRRRRYLNIRDFV